MIDFKYDLKFFFVIVNFAKTKSCLSDLSLKINIKVLYPI